MKAKKGRPPINFETCWDNKKLWPLLAKKIYQDRAKEVARINPKKRGKPPRVEIAKGQYVYSWQILTRADAIEEKLRMENKPLSRRRALLMAIEQVLVKTTPRLVRQSRTNKLIGSVASLDCQYRRKQKNSRSTNKP